MAGGIEELEKDLACGLEVVAKTLQERYVEFQPVLQEAEEDVVRKLEELTLQIDEKLQAASSFLRESNGELDSSGEKSVPSVITKDRNLRRKLRDLSDQRQLLDKLQNIEGLLISCRSGSLSKVDEARNLIECENLLNEITKDDGWAILTGRIRDILREEVVNMVEMLKFSLTYTFNDFVSYPTIDVKGTVHMRIRCGYPSKIEETLVALELFDELKWTIKEVGCIYCEEFRTSDLE
ncbi:hypothetical protein KIN20_023931 [Parelaphostrongylus tenuis]|uniref:Uncharacterized protein n=1 Tax=Parelaphostrongylus tenuis TaxID=148309 RepID=A0AAD5N9K6_PARTN|nr:hypothetical protein KIN20_023931 [Parelaphostrongylus tenuis]